VNGLKIDGIESDFVIKLEKKKRVDFHIISKSREKESNAIGSV